MIEQSIGAEAAVDCVEGRGFLELAPGPADAGRRIDNEAVALDQTGVDQWLEREDRGSRIAARGSDRFRAADGRAIELGNAVDEAAEEVGRLMLFAVPALVGR